MFNQAHLAALAAAASANPELLTQLTQLFAANGQNNFPQQQSASSTLPQQPQQSTSQQQNNSTTNDLQQISPQNLSFKRRGRRPKQPLGPGQHSLSSGQSASIGISSNALAASSQLGRLSGVNLPAALNNARSSNVLDGGLNQRMQLQLRLQQQREQQQQQQMQQDFAHRLQQQLQQIVQQTQRTQQTHPSLAEPSRQQQILSGQNAGVSGVLETQKRKRGRPPLSGPSTSTSGGTTSAVSAGATTGNFLEHFSLLAAMKNQQDNARQRENRLQREIQDRQKELRLQQERDMQLRMQQEREARIQQERERHRQMELEREKQRKHQHKLALTDIDRERRRQHMIMVRNLDAYKRNEEREKNMIAMMEERKHQVQKRHHQKKLEIELIKDIKKPVDDMMLKNQKPLATLNRIPGLKLPGKAFANLLMSFEFLYNFADTVGLEIKNIPDINTLQLGLLNIDSWAEDKLIETLHHLVMFAIKDQRFPYAGSLKEVENMEQNNEGLSQLLHFYLEVKMQAKFDSEYEDRLFNLTKQNYFLSLNATQKAEMLAYICNELLCSQNITKHMEDTIENVAKLRKDKWVLENEIRKYRVIKTKRELKEEADQKASEAAMTVNGQDVKKEESSKDEEKVNLPNGSSGQDDPKLAKGHNDESAQNTSTNQINASGFSDVDELEPDLTNEELNKKIENLLKQYNKTSNKLEKAINSMRVSPLGQDRYRRRYWVLPQVGGVFVEGMESSEPDELENNKFSEEELLEYEREQKALKELEEEKEQEEQKQKDGEEVKTENNDEIPMEIKDEASEIKDEDDAMQVKEEESSINNGIEMKEEVSIAQDENGDIGIDKETESTGEDAAITQAPRIPWFSILPRVSCQYNAKLEPEDTNEKVSGDEEKKVDEDGTFIKELSTEELKSMRHEICPALAKRLEQLEAEQHPISKKIHPQFQYGWWRITDSQQLKSILSVLHERGSRERVLQKHLTKHFQYACNSCRNSTVDFQITAYDRQLAGKNYGAPLPHTDDDSAEDLNDGEGEDQVDEEEDDEEAADETIQQQQVNQPKKKRKKAARSSLRSRRQRARNAARSRRQR